MTGICSDYCAETHVGVGLCAIVAVTVHMVRLLRRSIFGAAYPHLQVWEEVKYATIDVSCIAVSVNKPLMLPRNGPVPACSFLSNFQLTPRSATNDH